MLTNHLPFNADNPVSIAMKHVEEEPLPPSTYRADIPPMLEAIVMRAMNKNPDMRPSSFELVQELESVEKTLGVSKQVDPDATQVLQKVETPIPPRRNIPRPNQMNNRNANGSSMKQSFFKSKLFMAGLIFVLLIGFGVGSIIAFGSFGKQEEVTVPEVVGKQLALARQILEDGKLRVNVAETYDANVPPGQVVSQDPDPGKTVKSERLVTIYVSKGGEELDMPDLAGLNKSAAVEKIQKVGLNLGSIYEKYADEEPGTVLSHDPAAGTKIYRGQTIDLTISRGMVGHPEVSTVSSSRAAVNEEPQEIFSREGNSEQKNSESSQHENLSNPNDDINYSESDTNTNYETRNNFESESTEVFTAPTRDDSASKQRY